MAEYVKPTEAEMREFDRKTCRDCGHWLKAADRRYGQCLDCGRTLDADQLKR